MRNIFIIPTILIILSSCTLFNKNDGSFIALYQANIHSIVVSLDKIGTRLGVNRHESVDGTILTAISVPGILSGSLATQYTGLVDGRNVEAFFRNIQFLFTSLVSSGSISADEIGIISHGADNYLSYKNLIDAGMMSDNIKAVLKKYENTWLSLVDQSSSGMTTEELMGYNIARNLATKSLTDLEKYAIDYPVFRDTADLGMSGSLHFWTVELDRANILALSKQLTIDLVGTGMTDENIKNLEKNLKSVSFSGKLGFDPNNSNVSTLEGSLFATGKLVSNIAVIQNENGGSIRLSSPERNTTMLFSYGKKENRYNFDGLLTQSGTDMGKLTGYIEEVQGKFHEVSLEVSAQGMTATLRHTVDGDKFFGKLSAVVGTLEWSGTTSDEQITSLKINGTSPMGSLSAQLTEGTGGMIRGPIVVKSQEEILMNATLALQVAKQKFALILDVISEEFPAHFDLDISGKSTPSNKKVTAPATSQPFQNLLKEMDAVSSPESAFIETGTEDSIISRTGSTTISK